MNCGADGGMKTGRDERQLQTQWYRVSTRLKAEIGDTAFDNWIKPITVGDQAGSEIRLAVPSRFMRDWVLANYLDRLKELWTGENSAILSVEVIIQPTQKSTEGAKGIVKRGADIGEIRVGTASNLSSASEISAPLDPRFTFDQFIVGKPNEFAYAAARRVAEAASVPFNPLFLYGGVGLGKTHLMHAIAHEIHNREPKRTVMYLSAEKFMSRFARALREQNT